MKKRIIPSLIVSCTMILFSGSARAQWDLNGTAPNTTSAGAGNMVGNSQYPNLSDPTGQPYIYQAYKHQNFEPNNLPTQYNQRGVIGNPALGQGNATLWPTSTPRLSLMQNQGLINALPGGLKGTLNGLPPTSLDSFVRNAGGHAEAIYGDEGTNSWPPLSGFGPGNTINAGIVGQRSKTITTGHGGSRLPTASGNGTSISR